MIRIDELNIELPAAFEHRAVRIARLARERSSQLQLNVHRSMEELTLQDIEMNEGADDQKIADLIVARLEQALGGQA